MLRLGFLDCSACKSVGSTLVSSGRSPLDASCPRRDDIGLLHWASRSEDHSLQFVVGEKHGRHELTWLFFLVSSIQATSGGESGSPFSVVLSV